MNLNLLEKNINFFNHGIGAGRLSIAFFFRTAVEDEFSDVLDHIALFELQHRDLGEKEAHIQEDNSNEHGEDLTYNMAPE